MIDTSSSDESMAPGLLVASPRLDGSPFERAVILLVRHNDNGAMGYMINNPVDADFGTLIAGVNEDIEEAILSERFDQPVYFGGPVRIEQLWVIYRHSTPSGLSAEPGPAPLSLGGAVDGPANFGFGDAWHLAAAGHIIEDFALHRAEHYFMPVLGYTGWDAGQLEDEISEGSWLVADVDPTLVRSCPPGECWQRALDQLGVSPTTFLMMSHGGGLAN